MSDFKCLRTYSICPYCMHSVWVDGIYAYKNVASSTSALIVVVVVLALTTLRR